MEQGIRAGILRSDILYSERPDGERYDVRV